MTKYNQRLDHPKQLNLVISQSDVSKPPDGTLDYNALLMESLKWEEAGQKPIDNEDYRNSSRLGTLAESKAITWLLQQGYEVFNNVCSAGPLDLIIVDREGRTALIDVKTCAKRRNGFEETKQKAVRTEKQKALGVQLLMYRPENGSFFWVNHQS